MNKPADAYRLHIREIAAIRTALAYEAGGLAATLEYATFPKSPRLAAINLVGRMRRAARGDVDGAFPALPAAALSTCAPGPTQVAERCAQEVAQLRSVALSCLISLDSYLLFKSFPKSRRQVTLMQIERLQAAASGTAEVAYAGLPSYALTTALHDAGVTNVNVPSWEAKALSTFGERTERKAGALDFGSLRLVGLAAGVGLTAPHLSIHELAAAFGSKTGSRAQTENEIENA